MSYFIDAKRNFIDFSSESEMLEKRMKCVMLSRGKEYADPRLFYASPASYYFFALSGFL
jgi:hypothetical protein